MTREARYLVVTEPVLFVDHSNAYWDAADMTMRFEVCSTQRPAPRCTCGAIVLDWLPLEAALR